MADSRTPLEPRNFYHVYNHAVGNEKLFKTRNNYLFFLERLWKYLQEFVDIYCYCLMPNHFHLLARVKDHKSILSAILNSNPPMKLISDIILPNIISRQFSHLFNSYAQAYNKENQRKGSLFYNRYKRKLVDSEVYLKKLIHYIHYNPVESGFMEKVDEWEYSSYKAFIFKGETLVKRKEVLELFGDIEHFIFCHSVEPYEG